jgi:excisionase family DNA binding protein
MTPLLNAEQAAALLSVPKSWVLAQARADKIPHLRLGHYVRFQPEALEDWSREQARGPRRDKRHDEA